MTNLKNATGLYLISTLIPTMMAYVVEGDAVWTFKMSRTVSYPGHWQYVSTQLIRDRKATVEKGIKGIRKLFRENSSGWHVTVGDDYYGYYTKSVLEIMGMMDGFVFVGATGNGLHFREAI